MAKTLTFISLWFLVLASCADSPDRPLRILWPPPPERPILEFIGAYSHEDDFPVTANQRLVKLMVAERPLGLKMPFGIVSDGKGKVYVSDIRDRSIKVFDFNAKKVSYLTDGPFYDMPLGLALDGAGNLFVADGEKGKVLVFSPQGTPLFSFGDKEIFGRPAYIAINNRLGRIYVSDGRRHRIAVFDIKGSSLFFIGGPGAEKGQFAAPQGIAVDKKDRLFVADMLNARIQVFDAEGNFLYTFGKQGRESTYFENPKDLSFASDGNLYILDHRKALLFTYTPEGKLLLITGGAKRTSSRLGFSTPASIYIDSTDRVYITDQLNRRFSVWQYLSEDYLRNHPITEDEMKRVISVVNRSQE